MSKTIHILNGPNLNLLGQREPDVYGADTLADVEAMCAAEAKEAGLEMAFKQSNIEGELVDMIQAARGTADGIIINPAAYTHSSIAILDALNAYDGIVIELHISQVHKREEFRHHSFVSRRADAVMAGFGVNGYALAVQHMATVLA